VAGSVDSRANLAVVVKRNIIPCRQSNPGRPARSLVAANLSSRGKYVLPLLMFYTAFPSKHTRLLQDGRLNVSDDGALQNLKLFGLCPSSKL
jgi:hypothetical protein